MKDAYSFDISDDEAKKSYNKMFFAYLNTFKRLGLTAIPMAADTGPIGGDLSHEFIILAETGESKIYSDKRIFDIDISKHNSENDSIKDLRNEYASFIKNSLHLITPNLGLNSSRNFHWIWYKSWGKDLYDLTLVLKISVINSSFVGP